MQSIGPSWQHLLQFSVWVRSLQAALSSDPVPVAYYQPSASKRSVCSSQLPPLVGHVITAVQQAELALAAPRTDKSVLADESCQCRKRLTQHAGEGIDSQDPVAGKPASTDTQGSNVQAL